MTKLGACGLDFLNDKPVQGELLADRAAAAPLPPEEALRIALGIGEALTAAHAQGRFHGSLCPHAVVLNGGAVQLLAPEKINRVQALPYLSPEQFDGEKPDARSDIFSFGALLYELVSGRRAFEGSGAALLNAVRNEAPPALASPNPSQAALQGVIAGCLEKDPARRRQRARNVVTELRLCRTVGRTARAREIAKAPLPQPVILPPVPTGEKITAATQPAAPAAAGRTPAAARVEYWVSEPPAPRAGFSRRILVVGLAILAVAATAVATILYLHKQTAPVLRFAVAAPEHTSYPGTPAVSPDGSSLAFSAVGPEGHRMIWLRSFDEMHARMIPGTEDGFAPFWSPDSRYIGFFARGFLMKIRAAANSTDSSPQMVASTEAHPGGGTWNQDGVIVYSPGMFGGLFKVSANGGKPVELLKPDPEKMEHAYLWPQFLPDGRHFIYFCDTSKRESATGIYDASLDPGEKPHLLLTSQTSAVYSPGAADANDGYLLFMKDRDLMAQGLNASKLTLAGNPIAVATDVGMVETLSLAPVSVSSTGVLVYQNIGKATRQLVWMDRAGRNIGTISGAGDWGPPRISPDGSRAAAGKLGNDGKTAEIHIFASSGKDEPFDTGAASAGSPVWSPDGSRIVYWQQSESGSLDLYIKLLGGGKGELLYRSPYKKYPSDWSRDSKIILFGEYTQNSLSDIWGLRLTDLHAGVVLNTIHAEGYATLSPDARWLAYQSDETGANEIYVQPWDGGTPGTKRTWKVSSTGGGLPKWRADGGELFYITASGAVMSAAVHAPASEFQFDPPQQLFQTLCCASTDGTRFWNWFDVSGDGQRFLLNLPLEWNSSSLITVTTNWTKKLPSPSSN